MPLSMYAASIEIYKKICQKTIQRDLRELNKGKFNINNSSEVINSYPRNYFKSL